MKKLGKFEIIEKVGQGAMGVVYKARDPLIDRIVALKTITTGLAEDPNLLKRFYSEARSAGGLQHPHIVTIYELGHEGSTPFIAMQFLDGQMLKDWGALDFGDRKRRLLFCSFTAISKRSFPRVLSGFQLLHASGSCSTRRLGRAMEMASDGQACARVIDITRGCL